MTPTEIRNLRIRLGLSLRGMAQFLRLSPKHGYKTVWRWETGRQDLLGTAELVFDAIESGQFTPDLEPFKSHIQR